MKSTHTIAHATAAILSAALLAAAAVTPAIADDGDAKHSKHVLLLSVDGLHQKELDWYVGAHPTSALAALVARGTSYTHAQTPVPSDSFPGLIGQVTGGETPAPPVSTTTTPTIERYSPPEPRIARPQNRGRKSRSPSRPTRTRTRSTPALA
ncbi:alkaline phosphatase family protein [Lacisediminihabitans sp.]|uniref:alkaline phosphatase family protein n=1 Tax=Lacisediminihabitans sp. TaxID=2787631 RepID=UPI00374DD33A